MQNRDYWTKKLQQAEAELEAATRRSDVNAAASKLQRAKAELKGSSRRPRGGHAAALRPIYRQPDGA